MQTEERMLGEDMIDHAKEIVQILWAGCPFAPEGRAKLVAAVRAVPVGQCREVRREVIERTKREEWERSIDSSTDMQPSFDPRPQADAEMNRLSAAHARERQEDARQGVEYRYVVAEALRIREGLPPSLGCSGPEKELLSCMTTIHERK